MKDLYSRRRFEPGEQVFREGEAGDAAYVVERGEVEISALRRGRHARLATLGAGDLFGEMALIDDAVRMASATATKPTECLVITRQRVREELEGAGSLTRLVVQVLIDRLRSTYGLMLRYRFDLKTGEVELPGIEPGFEADLETTRRAALETMHVEEELDLAIRGDQLELFLQPIVTLDDGAIAGFEALVRWRHPERGLVPPGQFIGAAERSGIIVPMGLWALREGGRILRLLSARFPTRAPFLNINVSPRQLVEPGLLELLPQIVEEIDGDPSRLKLEVTESLLVDDPDAAILALQRIKETGVGVVLDDFGTGYSSLSYLHRFPIDAIKIDRSFVATLEELDTSRLIVNAMSSLAEALELDVVAEGIETTEQLAALREIRCTMGQGYLFAAPRPIDEAIVAAETS